MPQAAMRSSAGRATLCSRPASAITSISATTLTRIRYHTKGIPLREINRPKMPVRPARKTAVCRIISVRVVSFMVEQK